MSKTLSNASLCELLTAHPLSIRIVIPAGSDEAAAKSLDTLEPFIPWLNNLGLQTEILYCGRSYDPRLLYISSLFSSELSIRFDAAYEEARALSLYTTRPVFGTISESVFPALFLYENETLLYESRRISAASLEKLIQKALKIQARYLSEHILDFIDRPFSD